MLLSYCALALLCASICLDDLAFIAVGCASPFWQSSDDDWCAVQNNGVQPLPERGGVQQLLSCAMHAHRRQG